jgi:hypothetical protein
MIVQEDDVVGGQRRVDKVFPLGDGLMVVCESEAFYGVDYGEKFIEL